MRITEIFFARDTREVAKNLLGMYLARSIDEEILTARITSTEAYKGKEKRDGQGIFYAPGKIYMYPLRGHYILNIATEAESVPACVLIYEGEIKGKRYGCIKLPELLRIDKSFDGKSIESNELWIEDKKIIEEMSKASTCVGRYRLV